MTNPPKDGAGGATYCHNCGAPTPTHNLGCPVELGFAQARTYSYKPATPAPMPPGSVASDAVKAAREFTEHMALTGHALEHSDPLTWAQAMAWSRAMAAGLLATPPSTVESTGARELVESWANAKLAGSALTYVAREYADKINRDYAESADADDLMEAAQTLRTLADELDAHEDRLRRIMEITGKDDHPAMDPVSCVRELKAEADAAEQRSTDLLALVEKAGKVLEFYGNAEFYKSREVRAIDPDDGVSTYVQRSTPAMWEFASDKGRLARATLSELKAAGESKDGK